MTIPAGLSPSADRAAGEALPTRRRSGRPYRDLTHEHFGRLYVLERVPGPRPKWTCVCDCGTIKPVAACALISGDTLSCGCLRRENGAAKAVPIAERFWVRVEKGDGCWLWSAGMTDQGYGWIDAYRELGEGRAHRVSWILEYGPIPDELQVLHQCDTPACVRPDHLFLGTHADNMEDKINKGRQWAPAGESNPRARLTQNDVLAIRSATGLLREIGNRYGVHLTTVKAIKERRIWKHLP